MRIRLTFALLALALTLTAQAQQPEKGYWRAASTTAASITGDIEISASKVTINFTAFPMAQARTLTTSEVSAVFDADVNIGGTGTLYHLNVSAARRFLHHNTLCGSEDTQWMATFVTGHSMQVAFFSGQSAPVFTFDAISHTSDLCGTYSYVR